MRTHKYNQGFSLVETIIYLALFIMLSIAVVGSMITVVKIFVEIRSNRDFLDSGYTAMERMTREVRNALSVDTAVVNGVSNSVLNTDASPCVLQCTLQLNTKDNTTGADKTIKFLVTGGVLKLYENGTESGTLIGQNTTVTNLTFWPIGTPIIKAIRIQLTISDTRNSNHSPQTFYDTIIMRGAY